MSLITQNFNDKNLSPLNRKANNGKIQSFGSGGAPLSTTAIQDSVELNKKSGVSLKKQVAFQGILPKSSTITEFFRGSEKISAQEMFEGIIKYLPEDMGIVKSLKYDLYKEYKGEGGQIERVADELIQPTRPFHKNFLSGLVPKFILELPKKIFGGKKAREAIEIANERADTQNRTLGLWMNAESIAGKFDKGVFGEESHTALKDILKKDNEEELAEFFEEKGLKILYSLGDGKPSGILAKSENGENYLERFKKAILDDTAKPQESPFIEKIKKEFVRQTTKKKIEEKQGSFLPPYSQSIASLIARVVSGVIPAWFIANDFYNLRMSHSDDKKQAKDEWKSKFKQETGRIGIYAYSGFVLNSIFERLSNKSLSVAVGLNIINSVTSNVLSRMATKRPVLPVSVDKAVQLNQLSNNKKAEKLKNADLPEKPISDNKLVQLNTYKSFKNNSQVIGFGANNTGIINSIKSSIKNLDIKFMEATPLKLRLEDFERNYNKVKQLDKDDAHTMLGLVAKNMGIKKEKSELTINDILEHAKDTKEVIIGNNWIYRYSKNAIKVIMFPVDLAITLGKSIINPVRKLFGKKPLKSNKEKEFYSEQFIKNVTKQAEKVEQKIGTVDSTDTMKLEEAQRRYSSHKKKFFSTKIMEYPAEALSNAMKLTGFVTVPFLAVDAYNVTLGETKDKDLAYGKTRQRAVQDSARQGVSFWISYGFNQMGKFISNASLAGNAAVIAVAATGYESLTRIFTGQPILPQSHEKMVEIDKKRANKKKSWLQKVMGSKIKTNNVDNLASTPVSGASSNPATSLNSSAPAFSLNPNSPNVPEIYKKFYSKS